MLLRKRVDHDLRDNNTSKFLPHGQLSHQSKMHEAFSGTSLGIAVFEVPTSGLEWRPSCAAGVIVVLGGGAVARSSGIFLALCVFLVADHSGLCRDNIAK